MRDIEWAMWANEQAFISLCGVIIGAIVGLAAQFENWEFAAFVLPASCLIMVFEYPRSKRAKKNSTMERRFQNLISPVVMKLKPVSTNYFVRFAVHIVFSVFTCFMLPTLMGGMSLMLAAILYLIAGIKGEEWNNAGDTSAMKTESNANISQPPNRPPPRAPVTARNDRAREPVRNQDIHLQEA